MISLVKRRHAVTMHLLYKVAGSPIFFLELLPIYLHANKMATQKRFAQTTDDEVQNKRLKLNAKNTLMANKKCGNILRDYLQENHMDDKFMTFDAVRLNEVLARFYMDLRKPDGDHYKSTSLEGIRSGLNRYLKSPPHNKPFDIVKDSAFSESNKNFKAMGFCSTSG